MFRERGKFKWILNVRIRKKKKKIQENRVWICQGSQPEPQKNVGSSCIKVPQVTWKLQELAACTRTTVNKLLQENGLPNPHKFHLQFDDWKMEIISEPRVLGVLHIIWWLQDEKKCSLGAQFKMAECLKKCTTAARVTVTNGRIAHKDAEDRLMTASGRNARQLQESQ